MFFLFGFLGGMYAQQTITLLFAGDLMQHGPQIKAAEIKGAYDYSSYFHALKGEISKADIAVANLEVTLGGKPYVGYPRFSAPDGFIYAVKQAGFDVLLTANNHCMDRGQKGLERTIRMLDSLHLKHVGTYKNKTERLKHYPLMVEKNGFKIAFLNYTYDTNGLPVISPNVVNIIDKEQIKKDILAARCLRPDVIIACMHWGIEYQTLPRQTEKELAEWMVHMGVDHVIGSHPHVLQPIEAHEDSITPERHLIVYSLGNFGSNMSKPDTDGGAMVKLTLKKVFDHTLMQDCGYTFIWTSRPHINGEKGYLLYPSTYINKELEKEEHNYFNTFLNRARTLYKRYNKGIKEYTVN